MNTDFDKIFWAALIGVGIWAALTPGRQLSFLPENRYRKLPPIVTVLAFLVLAGLVFRTK